MLVEITYMRSVLDCINVGPNRTDLINFFFEPKEPTLFLNSATYAV